MVNNILHWPKGHICKASAYRVPRAIKYTAKRKDCGQNRCEQARRKLRCKAADQKASQAAGSRNELEDLDVDAARSKLSLGPIGNVVLSIQQAWHFHVMLFPWQAHDPHHSCAESEKTLVKKVEALLVLLSPFFFWGTSMVAMKVCLSSNLTLSDLLASKQFESKLGHGRLQWPIFLAYQIRFSANTSIRGLLSSESEYLVVSAASPACHLDF